MDTRRYRLTGPDSLAAAAAEGVKVLREGGLLAFPTETVYGVAACATNAGAMERLRALKDRPARPFTVHLGRIEQVAAFVAAPPAEARRVMKKAWPGPLTVVLPTGGRLATEAWNPSPADQLCYEDTIGLRLPDDAAAQAILGAIDPPVVAASANLAGGEPPTTADGVLEALGGRIDLVIDAGPCPVGRPSTIVRFQASGGLEVLREGAVSARALEVMSRRQILFICTGNTCRSPMAEGLARRLLAERLGCLPGELPLRGWYVISAGTMGGAGLPPTEQAVAAAAERGADISGHCSWPATADVIRGSDLILCMTEAHRRQIIQIAPAAADRVERLDPDRDIADPVGGSLEVYRRAIAQIARAVEARLDGFLTL
ncbi:MAG: threonylcarbamoyl-AMP synthase [Planctomycetes bacterium]|nr:threonylcarbamoyl-AMP synthase [Planctomycetota bacterium]